MKRRPLIFWLLLAASIGTIVWWALYVHRDPQAPLRAIPANATWLALHNNLAARWDAISDNPLIASIAGALDIEAEEWQEIAGSEDTRKFLNILARDEVALAYVPEMRATGREAWVFSSWLGGRSQRLRWTLNSIKDPALRRASARNGWHVWVWTPKGMKNGARVTLAIVEGMLVGCISDETIAIEDVLECYDRRLPSLVGGGEVVGALTSDSPDRGWVRLPRSGGWGARIHYKLTFLEQGGLAGAVYVPGAPVFTTPAPATNSLNELSDILRDHPVAALVLDRGLAREWVQEAYPNPVGSEIAGLLGGEESGAVALALVGDPYSGRFMAVRLPGLLAAVTTPDPSKAALGISAALDRLNARYPWGLVPYSTAVGTQRVIAIESTGRTTYAKVDDKERLAFAPLQQSLLFSSNLETLTKLLREAHAAPPADSGRFSRGLQRMRDHHALGYFWVDLQQGSKVLRLAVTAWSLKLLVEDPQGSQPARQKLNEAKAWIDALAPQKTLQLWVRPRQEFLEYEFRLGGEE